MQARTHRDTSRQKPLQRNHAMSLRLETFHPQEEKEEFGCKLNNKGRGKEKGAAHKAWLQEQLSSSSLDLLKGNPIQFNWWVQTPLHVQHGHCREGQRSNPICLPLLLYQWGPLQLNWLCSNSQTAEKMCAVLQTGGSTNWSVLHSKYPHHAHTNQPNFINPFILPFCYCFEKGFEFSPSMFPCGHAFREPMPTTLCGLKSLITVWASVFVTCPRRVEENLRHWGPNPKGFVA